VPDEQLTKTMRDLMPLCAHLDMDAEEMDASCVRMAIDWDERLCTTNGLMHGGVIMTLADTAGAMCASANLPSDATGTSTIESKTNFLGAVRDGRIVATSRPLHVGSTTVVVETEVRRASDDRLVAKVTQTQIVLRAR
jgi:1,4-dihydroxy-2-naphthoyl-CoA hydrolase